uniref:ATP-dependent Clp protease proteolytic subunit n=1 Tax=Rhopalocnemis phalloides TaxID=1128106 RepID=A0A3S8PZB7_9MAGN|nr:ATP-dependent Clp protease proteolytic subunit [Rhopalocnemis phalloides]
MPIGVPRVLFKPIGILEYHLWIDIYNRLYRDKILFLGQEIDTEISNQIITIIIYFNIETENEDINFFLNSSGGCIASGFSIFDTMQFSYLNIKTICYGLSTSMASIILVGGLIKKRLAFLHARIMIHQPSIAYFEGTTSELILETEELLRLRILITEIYSQRTNKTFWIIYNDMERDTYMSALESKLYGMIDIITK